MYVKLSLFFKSHRLPLTISHPVPSKPEHSDCQQDADCDTEGLESQYDRSQEDHILDFGQQSSSLHADTSDDDDGSDCVISAVSRFNESCFLAHVVPVRISVQTERLR